MAAYDMETVFGVAGLQKDAQKDMVRTIAKGSRFPQNIKNLFVIEGLPVERSNDVLPDAVLQSHAPRWTKAFGGPVDVVNLLHNFAWQLTVVESKLNMTIYNKLVLLKVHEIDMAGYEEETRKDFDGLVSTAAALTSEQPGRIGTRLFGMCTVQRRGDAFGVTSTFMKSNIPTLCKRPDLEGLLDFKIFGRPPSNKLWAVLSYMEEIEDFYTAVLEMRDNGSDIERLAADIGELQVGPKPMRVSTKGKGGKKATVSDSGSSSRRPQQPQVFVKPPAAYYQHAAEAEILRIIGRKRFDDYHHPDVCPDTLQQYPNQLECTSSNTPSQLRHKRDRAVGCGWLRAKTMGAFVKMGLHDAGHEVPISRAYALGMGCSRRLASSSHATDNDRTVDGWLQLKRGLVQPRNSKFASA